MSDMLDKVKELNRLLKQVHAGEVSFEAISTILSNMMDANIYTLDNDGVALGFHLKVEKDSKMISDIVSDRKVMPAEDNEVLLKSDEAQVNLHGKDIIEHFRSAAAIPEKFYTIIPISGKTGRCGTLFMTRYEPEFSDEELAIGELAATIVGLQIQQITAEKQEREQREAEIVTMAISTLSYSEAEAVQHIFAELEGEEGILVASKIADRSGITRSVIVNALRKLESAGVIETRSLGMKGTRIKILNQGLKPELEKMKGR